MATYNVDTILNMSTSDFQDMTVSAKRKILSTLVSAGNKRLRRFDAKNESSPAVSELRRSGPDYLSTKGKNETQLVEEFERAVKFMKQKSSTVSGYNQIVKKIKEGLIKKNVIKKRTPIKQVKKLLSEFSRLLEVNPDAIKQAYRYESMRKIMMQMEDENTISDLSDVFQRINEDIKKSESNIHDYSLGAIEHENGFASFFSRGTRF